MRPMNRLLLELERLYGLRPGPAQAVAAEAADDGGHGPGLRVAVLAVSHPAGWAELSAVWRGVQSDLELPAPAIALSGTDALQLWFAFASPTASSARTRFLHGLRARYLRDVKPSQVRMFTEAADLPTPPCVEVAPQRWSAFVTHDLASVFGETPWLDIAPGDEGQAALLRTLAPIPQVALQTALNRFGAIEHAEPSEQPPAPRHASDPSRFLSVVMNDETAPLALRIEAARILLHVEVRELK